MSVHWVSVQQFVEWPEACLCRTASSATGKVEVSKTNTMSGCWRELYFSLAERDASVASIVHTAPPRFPAECVHHPHELFDGLV